MNDRTTLADQIGVNERTLRRAIAAGTLRAERPTPRKLTMSGAEKRYLLRSWDRIATLREVLRTEANVRFALLFGSVARGDDDADSDLDLLVEMRDASLNRGVDLGAKLEGLLGSRVDVLSLDGARENARLLSEAIDEGRVIVDREGRWSALQDESESLRRRARRESGSKRRRALGRDRSHARRRRGSIGVGQRSTGEPIGIQRMASRTGAGAAAKAASSASRPSRKCFQPS
jgi:predicted nucleotidyltransferase